MIYLCGAPPHQDMYDLKMDAPAEIRGPFRPIKTNVPGIEICEHLPRLARIMDKLGTNEIFSISTPMLRADVAGIIPNVPGLIAGHPQGMFARHFEEGSSGFALDRRRLEWARR